MNKGILFLVAIVIAVLAWSFIPKKAASVGAPSPTPIVSKASEAPVEVVQAQQRMMMAPRQPLEPLKGNEVSPECQTFFDDIRRVDLSQAGEFPPKGNLFPKGERCSKPNAALEALDAKYRESCLKVAGNNEVTKDQYLQMLPQCYLAFFQYRAQLTDFLTKDKKLEEINDPQVLADKLMTKMIENPAQAAEIAERLSLLEPNFYPATKAALMSRFMDANDPKNANDPEKAKKVDELIKRAESQNPKDASELFEIEIMSQRTRGASAGDIENRAADYSRKYPEKGVGPYYSAWGLLQKGDKAGAIQSLNESIRREPLEARFRETLRKVEAGQIDGAFEMTAKFGLNPQEFYKP